jgi:alkanesulfonate monooxygenase SsuD/methylene tetrahydromethanopterin reductase-like flavin-dependent oxidoreductase (luciferase family)
MIPSMHLGLSMNSAYAVPDVRTGAQWMVERARAAASAGLDSLFLGDHHATPIPYYQNVPMLGRLLAEWQGPVTGALFLLPLWHPLLVAEQVGTLASLSAGRFVLQCAIGPRDNEFPAFGVDPRERPSRFEQSLALLRRWFAGEVMDHEGHWTLAEARVAPVPPEPVEVWIGATAAPAIDRAARLGDGWLAGPQLDREAAASQLAEYRERCDAHGRPAGACAIRRDVYVGSSPDEARATAAPILEAGHRGFPTDATIVGGIDEVAAAIRELENTGYDHVIVRNLVRDQQAALGCIERLAGVREALAHDH